MESRFEEYYGIKYLIFNKYFNHDLKSIKYSKKNDKNVIYIENKKYNIKAEYQILGLLDMNTNIWTWGYDLRFIERDLIKSSKKIRKNVRILEIKNMNEENLYYLNNSSFSINIEKMDFFIKLLLYYSDGNWIINIVRNNNSNLIEFILIKNILNIY